MSAESGHVGDLVSALVDGALDHDTRDRLLAHLATCPACRAEVEDERRVKARLGRLADPDVPAELTTRLLGLRPPPAGTHPRSRRDSRRPPRRRSVRRRIAASTGGVAAALSLAFLVGGGAPAGRPVTPQVDRFTVDHAAVTGEVPLTGPAGTGVTVSFATSGSP